MGALDLPPAKKLLLTAHLDGILAEEELRTTGGKDLSPDGLFALVLRATGSKVQATRAARDRVAAQLRAGESPQ